MAEDIQPEMRPLVQQLQRRYPDVRIVQARRTSQQWIRYQAPLAVLRSHGLVTSGMLRGKGLGCSPFSSKWLAVSSIGDGFQLCRRYDDQSRQGCWDLIVYTRHEPTGERPRFDTSEARRLLKAIARRSVSVS